jgi:F-type H+-transporting ATPase subunit delta
VSAFARSYARALVESAPKRDEVENLLAGAGAVARAIGSEPRLKEFFAAPAIPREAKERALQSLGEKAGLDAFGRRFLAVVLANRRILHLGEILAAAREELDRALGVAQAHVRVAASIAPEEERKIAAALGKSVGGAVRLQVAVDESILGGFVARVGSRVIDASVASAIARFQERTKETAGA